MKHEQFLRGALCVSREVLCFTAHLLMGLSCSWDLTVHSISQEISIDQIFKLGSKEHEKPLFLVLYAHIHRGSITTIQIKG